MARSTCWYFAARSGLAMSMGRSLTRRVETDALI
eukprot:CAMPEP_0194686336 /NCGR_PEP_ID=MMETSP0295-20121207/15438_1 /TAXON_ID=39354 /ORGANISM="Heterosigma akashiwo, Strain CCMP2393" /LENGTH=33 /DNA_ID= /DNA_START= /DNA_END= /DNA_ORIENTATION=